MKKEKGKMFFKRITAVLMAVIMLLCVAPLDGVTELDFSALKLKVSANDELTTTGKCGENVIWNYNSETKELIISGTGDMDDGRVTISSDYYKAEHLVVEDGVTSIGYNAFYNYTDLVDVTLPNSLKKIGAQAFGWCCNLKEIVIPEGVTEIGGSAFANCSLIMEVSLPKSLEVIQSEAFYNCYMLSDIIIPEGVSTIGCGAFDDCGNLKSITILNPNCIIDEETYTIPSYITIYGYENSTAQVYADMWGKPFKVICIHSNILNFETTPKTCTENGYTAGIYCNDCKEWISGHEVIEAGHIDDNDDKSCDTCGDVIKTIVESGYCGTDARYVLYDDGTLVISGEGEIEGSYFYSRSDISSLKIEDGITNIGEEAFSFCESLERVIIPDSVTRIEGLAFYRCFSLQSIDIPENVEEMDYRVFEMCTRLKNINVDENNLYYTSENGVLFNKDKTKIVYYPAGKSDSEYSIPNGVKIIGDFSFEYSDTITKVIIPDSVTTIGSNAFECCSNLQDIVIPNGVTYIGEDAFRECLSLTSVTIPDSVTEICGFAFSLCSGLKDVKLPNNIETIREGTFNNCKSLDKIEIPNSVENVENMAFYGCYNLEAITFYNPDCVIFDGDSTIWQTATIYGYANSTAQDYAEKYDRKFVDLECSEPSEPTTEPTTIPVTKPTETTTASATQPTTQAPVTEPAPVTTTGKTEETTQAPATQPTTSKPVETTKPIATEPTTAPSTTAPVTQAPTVTEPATQPTTAKPVESTKPIATEPTTAPSTTAPVTQAPTVTEPTAQTPTVTEPATKPSEESTTVHTHTEVIIPAVPATYTKSGKTEGKECSVCGEILVAQKKVSCKKLKKVTSLKVKKTTSSSVTLSWKKVTGADSYKVYYSTNGKKWKSVKVTKNTATIKKLSSAKNYQFKVRAFAGKYYGEASKVVKATTKFTTATLSKVTSSNKKQAAVNWKKTKNASGYVVEYSTSKNFTKKTTKTVTVKNGKTTKTTLKKLKSGKKYYVRVKAYKTVNKKAVYGEYSKVKTVKVK